MRGYNIINDRNRKRLEFNSACVGDIIIDVDEDMFIIAYNEDCYSLIQINNFIKITGLGDTIPELLNAHNSEWSTIVEIVPQEKISIKIS